jgi:hypothetical protein
MRVLTVLMDASLERALEFCMLILRKTCGMNSSKIWFPVHENFRGGRNLRARLRRP